MRINEIWSFEDVSKRFDDLLKLVDRVGAQEISHNGRTYVIQAKDSGATSRAASSKKKLAAGGLLSDADVKDAFD
ncbi:hypothetical protein [Phyllobacterium myrsinacearum]|uniref:Uncharacterized protein n=1 Tax=Phyllobacterium myrsinacearum TaxID=28101 RepID=A0A839EJ58_9HYPH|nr:hypothetical protein [Phyllobacterium myrsinacearum]MBA8878285.1 hypothetical protein [Phyllobacterium myrsinacearum]